MVKRSYFICQLSKKYQSWSSPSSYTCWHPSFLHRCAIEKLNWINSIVQLHNVEAQTFNSHVIIIILDSDWLLGSEKYSNRVRVHVWNRTNRTNLRIFYSEEGVFVQKIHNSGANGPGILLAIVSMVEDGNVNDWSKKEKMSVSTSMVYCAKILLFKYIYFHTHLTTSKTGTPYPH